MKKKDLRRAALIPFRSEDIMKPTLLAFRLGALAAGFAGLLATFLSAQDTKAPKTPTPAEIQQTVRRYLVEKTGRAAAGTAVPQGSPWVWCAEQYEKVPKQDPKVLYTLIAEHLVVCILVSGAAFPGLAQQKLENTQELEKLIAKLLALRDPHPFPLFVAIDNDSQTLFLKKPAASVMVVGKAIAKLDLDKPAEVNQAYRAVDLLSGLLHPDSLEQLDRLHQATHGDKGDRPSLRFRIVHFVNVNRLGPRETLLKSFPQQTLPYLAKWLQIEDDPRTLEGGLTLYTDYATELPDALVKQARAAKLPEHYLAWFARKVKLNGLRFPDFYKAAMSSINRVSQETEKPRPFSWEEYWLEHAQIWYFTERLRSTFSPQLQPHIKEVDQLITQVDKRLIALPNQIKAAKSDDERAHWEWAKMRLNTFDQSLRRMIGKEKPPSLLLPPNERA